MTDSRSETNSLGPRQLPREAVWGIHTARALENFPITGVPLAHFPELVRALAMVKKAAALAIRDLGALGPGIATAIASACDEIIAGRHHEHFVVDMIQGGAGTSTDVNSQRGDRQPGAQGSRPRARRLRAAASQRPREPLAVNDVYPTAIRLAVLEACAPLRAERAAGGRLRGARPRLRARDQGRPHPAAGRGADDARHGVRRLRRHRR